MLIKYGFFIVFMNIITSFFITYRQSKPIRNKNIRLDNAEIDDEKIFERQRSM